MDNQNLTPARIDVLLNTAASNIEEYPVAEQIKIYRTLADALPNGPQQSRARELAQAFSRVDALQLEFQQTMNGEKSLE